MNILNKFIFIAMIEPIIISLNQLYFIYLFSSYYNFIMIEFSKKFLFFILLKH